MKHLSFIMAALALSAPLLQAKVYDITLSDATTYRQCQIKYRGTNIKFVGLDKKGKMQTVTVPSKRVLNIREVEEEKADEPEKKPVPAKPAAEPKPEPKPEEAKDGEAKPAEGAEAPAGEAKEGEAQPAEGAEAPAEQAKEGEAKPAGEEEAQPADGGQAQDASLRLREKLNSAQEAFKELRAPSKSLQSTVRYTTQNINRMLDKLDRQALSVAQLQHEYNETGTGEFTFEVVTEEQRSQYERDGKAAYEAMVIDMKEKPGARKVGGIDKYEIMRERYQGMPEYKQAHQWYGVTLKALDRKWGKMLANEERRRKSASTAKKASMAEADEQELEKLRQVFEKDEEDIATVWYNPRPRNLAMLRNAHNKAKQALRTYEKQKLDEAVGTVPSLLRQFWENMDNARRLMIEGHLEQAEDALKEDNSLKQLTRLNRSIFPNEYRSPLTEQHRALENEIRNRQRKTTALKRKLETEAAQLERSASNAEAQIDALLEDIQREKDLDSGENTVVMEDSMKEPEGEAAAEGSGTEAQPEQQLAEEKKA